MLAAMAKWTADDIPPQQGRVALVTGANSGIGYEAALALARAGATVIAAARDPRRGEDAVARIRAAAPRAAVELQRLDLADLESVRRAAAEVAERHDRLDLLINNAGVMALPRRETADGFEMQFGTNHLGHFALTGLLLEPLRAAPAPRVVTISSGAHRAGRMRWDDLQGERRYHRWLAYGQSKLANLLFAFELQRRAERAGLGLRSMAAHPGFTHTNLQNVGPLMQGQRLKARLGDVGYRLISQGAARGALPTLYAATVENLPGATYVGPDGPLEWAGHPTVVTAKATAYDPGDARRLWEVSQELTGVRAL
jgi:NAD(P)-dependent dehydrogenase (short-subunit alcohol dehydrogenase family)